MSKKVEKPLTILVKGDLEAILRERAAVNHRSLTKEIVYLVETALGVSSENVRQTIHLLYKMNAEVTTAEASLPPV